MVEIAPLEIGVDVVAQVLGDDAQRRAHGDGSGLAHAIREARELYAAVGVPAGIAECDERIRELLDV